MLMIGGVWCKLQLFIQNRTKIIEKFKNDNLILLVYGWTTGRILNDAAYFKWVLLNVSRNKLP